MTIGLTKIDLKENDLLFYSSFIKRLGGKKKARLHLLNIIDRYFNEEYLDPDLEHELNKHNYLESEVRQK